MDFTKPVFGQKKMILCGHRGDRTGEDENTMAAFRRAVENGCDMIETDVHRTKDGVIVLRHDSLVPGAGEIKECTYEELKTAGSDLAKLEELAALAAENPELGLLIELKDVPPSSPGGSDARLTHPAPYSGQLTECSGLVRGPQEKEKPTEAAQRIHGSYGTSLSPDDRQALECADEAARILLEYGLGNRVWILSFSGSILEYVYKKYGRAFHYHAFYPWFIMGDMETDPAEFCELACMQHRYLSKEGFVVHYEDPLCPESWWKDVLAMKMIPVGAPSLLTEENYRKAMEYGCGMINADDPVRIRSLFEP